VTDLPYMVYKVSLVIHLESCRNINVMQVIVVLTVG